MTLYGLRHCGPSADRAENRRSLVEVKKRGRWAADSYVRRYEKAGRLRQAVERTRARSWTFCQLAANNIQAYLADPRLVPPPPQ